MIQWIYIFLLSLILFLLLIDWSTLTQNISFGLLCGVHFVGLDILNNKLNYWHYLRTDYSFPKLFIFSNTINIFNIGTVFFMGILFVQFLPKNYFLQLMFQIAEHAKMIQFIHWRTWMYFYIIPLNMLTLVWLKNTIGKRKDKFKYENFNRNND
jgi:hypothetical protein